MLLVCIWHSANRVIVITNTVTTQASPWSVVAMTTNSSSSSVTRQAMKNVVERSLSIAGQQHCPARWPSCSTNITSDTVIDTSLDGRRFLVLYNVSVPCIIPCVLVLVYCHCPVAARSLCAENQLAVISTNLWALQLHKYFYALTCVSTAHLRIYRER